MSPAVRGAFETPSSRRSRQPVSGNSPGGLGDLASRSRRLRPIVVLASWFRRSRQPSDARSSPRSRQLRLGDLPDDIFIFATSLGRRLEPVAASSRFARVVEFEVIGLRQPREPACFGDLGSQLTRARLGDLASFASAISPDDICISASSPGRRLEPVSASSCCARLVEFEVI